MGCNNTCNGCNGFFGNNIIIWILVIFFLFCSCGDNSCGNNGCGGCC